MVLYFDPHKELRVSKDADFQTIRAAYTKAARENHPDRFPNVTEQEMEVLTEKMKRINIAYDMLKSSQEPNTNFKHAADTSSTQEPDIPIEILIVKSKLKDYIYSCSKLRTSGGVYSVLSHIVSKECNKAINRCKEAGRKTVMDRDFDAWVDINSFISVGSQVKVEWHNEWYDGQVTAVHEDGRRKVHYKGYPNDQDEWVSINRLKVRG
jgi:hypothetical protein